MDEVVSSNLTRSTTLSLDYAGLAGAKFPCTAGVPKTLPKTSTVRAWYAVLHLK